MLTDIDKRLKAMHIINKGDTTTISITREQWIKLRIVADLIGIDSIAKVTLDFLLNAYEMSLNMSDRKTYYENYIKTLIEIRMENLQAGVLTKEEEEFITKEIKDLETERVLLISDALKPQDKSIVDKIIGVHQRFRRELTLEDKRMDKELTVAAVEREVAIERAKSRDDELKDVPAEVYKVVRGSPTFTEAEASSNMPPPIPHTRQTLSAEDIVRIKKRKEAEAQEVEDAFK